MLPTLARRCAQRLASTVIGLGFTCLAVAQPALPFQLLERFDKPLESQGIGSNGRRTIVVYADELDLANTAVSAIRDIRYDGGGTAIGLERVQDFVIVAKTIKIGPRTSFDTSGLVGLEPFENLRGGDIYLVADTLVVNGVWQGQPGAPWTITQTGGINPTGASSLAGRSGRSYILVNRVALADEFFKTRVSALNSAGKSNDPIPAVILKVISRGFSEGNSIHRVVASGTQVRWGGLGDAYQAWLSEEPVSALASRELRLVQKRNDPANGQNIPDIVAPMGDAIRYLPSEILAPWYVMYLERNATLAQVAISSKNFDSALQSVRDFRPFLATAPTQALTSSRFKKALADIQEVEKVLAAESVVEELTFPIDGAAPVRVTVIRDLAAGRVSVVPHQVLFSTVLDNSVFRVGFVTQEQGDVRVNMHGRLTVDPSVLELVRVKFPGTSTEVRVADELIFDTLSLGLGDALKDGRVQVLGGGAVSFDMLLKGTQYRQAMLRLAQPYGLDATVNWRHPRLPFGDRTTRVNVALGRTELSMVGVNGKLTNASTQAVDVDYVLDETKVLTNGFPQRLVAGQSLTVACTAQLCYAPGSAIRRVLPPAELDTWLVSSPAGSSVMTYSFDNKLVDSLLGSFQQLVLEVTYIAAPGSAPQRTGAFTLGRRGSLAAKKSWSFIGPPAGGAKLEITGRAHWRQGYIDIPSKTVESLFTEIDATWLKTQPP